MFVTHVIESEGFEFALRVDAVEIDVIKIGSRPAILVHQREGWTVDVFLGGGLEDRGNSLDQRGFAGAEIAAQQH